MIVKYPTGLYAQALPRSPKESGSVTFTISSTDPPRTNLLFPKLPPGIGNRGRPPRLLDRQARRRAVQNLVFTVAQSRRTATGTAMREYETGQILVIPSPPEDVSEQFTPGAITEIRHDTGLLDYDRLGLADKQEIVESAGESAFREIQQQLVQLRAEYDNLQVELQDNQKLTVETDKALRALVSMESTDEQIAAMIEQLKAKRVALVSRRGTLVNRAGQVSRDTDRLQTQLRDVAQVVR